jgi:hypothetical protein
LKALLKEQIVVDEGLATIIAEVTNILNSRPLMWNSSDRKDSSALTPAKSSFTLMPSPLPLGVFGSADHHTQRLWRQAQFLANLFWKRWTKEYLSANTGIFSIEADVMGMTFCQGRMWNSRR